MLQMQPAAAGTSQTMPQMQQQPQPQSSPGGAPQHAPQFSAAAFASALGSQGAQPNDASTTSPTSAFSMLGKSAPTNAAVPTSAQTPEQLIASALNQALAGERKTLPSWNGSPSTLRSWLKLIALWEYESNVPVEKRGIKLLQSFPEGSQPRRIADTIPTEVLLSANGYGAILGALHQKYAPFLEATAPQAIDKFLFDGERQKGESFTSYIAAKTLAKQEMELQLGEVINDRLCGRILLKHANLNDLQREMLLLRGPMLRPFDEIANLLRPLDRPEMLARAQEPSSSRNYMITSDYYQDYYPDNPENEEDNETEGDPMDLESWPHEDGDESASCDENGNCLFYMEDREYQETEAIELKAYHLAYRDARRELQKRKTERGYVKHGRDPGRSKGGKKGVRRPFVKGRGKGKSKRKQSSSRSWKANEEDLESRTRCWNIIAMSLDTSTRIALCLNELMPAAALQDSSLLFTLEDKQPLEYLQCSS